MHLFPRGFQALAPRLKLDQWDIAERRLQGGEGKATLRMAATVAARATRAAAAEGSRGGCGRG